MSREKGKYRCGWCREQLKPLAVQIAQAQLENLTLVTRDGFIQQYAVSSMKT